jgi:hypothetical protein
MRSDDLSALLLAALRFPRSNSVGYFPGNRTGLAISVELHTLDNRGFVTRS